MVQRNEERRLFDTVEGSKDSRDEVGSSLPGRGSVVTEV